MCPQAAEPKDVPLPCDTVLDSPSVSPAPLQREDTVVFPKRYVNPRFNENLPPPPVYPTRPLDRTGTPNTWVSTEPADDMPMKQEEIGERYELVDEGLYPATSPVPSSSQESVTSSSSTIRRTFTSLLCNSSPVASLFSPPREELDSISREARRNGLYTGLIHRPRQPEPVKQEGGGLQRASSWWLILGHSAEAVTHLLEMQDTATMARASNESRTAHIMDSPVPVGSYPVDVMSIRNSTLDIVFASMMGGLIVFYLLSIW